MRRMTTVFCWRRPPRAGAGWAAMVALICGLTFGGWSEAQDKTPKSVAQHPGPCTVAVYTLEDPPFLVKKTTYKYDKVGRTIRTKETNYEYDKPAVYVTRHVYKTDTQGRILQETRKHDFKAEKTRFQVAFTNTYNAASLLVSRTEKATGGTREFKYEYDAAGRLTKEDVVLPNGVVAKRTLYEYDGRGHLSSRRHEWPAGKLHRTVKVETDAIGNVVRELHKGPDGKDVEEIKFGYGCWK